MANATVLEFSSVNTFGQPIWPPRKITRGATTLTVSTQPGTIYVLISCDADSHVTTDGATPTAYDVPILSAIATPFDIGGGSLTFKIA